MSQTTITFNKVQRVVTDIIIDYGYAAKQVTPTTSLTKDLGFDSLDLAELVLRAEQVFAVDLSYELLEEEDDTIAGFCQVIWETFQESKDTEEFKAL